MYSAETKADAFSICTNLVKEGFAYVIKSDSIGTAEDRIYMKVI